MIRIDIDDRAVLRVLSDLLRRVSDPAPALRDIGEYLVASTRRRFGAGLAPDGTPWAPNSPVTIMRHLGKYGGSFRRRGGGLTKKGAARAAAKRPLIGETRRLSSEIAYRLIPRGVEVGSSLVYSAVQQLGARRGQFGRTRRGAPIPWGDIPARPFLGISTQDRDRIIAIIADAILRAGRRTRNPI
ncbi:MAG: phage virion morphogenesis protein [Burkholderiaceae bacterium]